MDKIRLKMLYTSNHDARAVIDSLGDYKRNVSETTVDTFMCGLNGKGLDAARVRNVLRELERIGVGEFVVGRRGSPTRMVWRTPVSSLVKEARGEAEVESPKATTHEHSYLVRPGFSVKFELPIDLTQSESARVGEFIKTLHMG